MKSDARLSTGTIEMIDKPKMEEILTAFVESWQQLRHDVGGEVYDWHMPRLNKVMLGLTSWFPADMAAAMEKAKSPYDE